MPTNAVYRSVPRGRSETRTRVKKNHFFAFQRKKTSIWKQWIHALRRDVGPYFSVNKGTRVFSRHLREEDLQRSLNGKISLRTGAVPSIFARKRSLPCKQAPPTPRIPATTLAKRKASEASEAMDSSQKFGFIKRVDKGWITTVKDLESWRFER